MKVQSFVILLIVVEMEQNGVLEIQNLIRNGFIIQAIDTKILF